MLRSFCILTPGTKADGTRCLRGTLSRDFTATASDGSERRYPAGTPLVLTKNRNGSYSLLAQLPDPAADLAAELCTPAAKAKAVPFRPCKRRLTPQTRLPCTKTPSRPPEFDSLAD